MENGTEYVLLASIYRKINSLNKLVFIYGKLHKLLLITVVANIVLSILLAFDVFILARS